jgi:hypothetical protein
MDIFSEIVQRNERTDITIVPTKIKEKMVCASLSKNNPIEWTNVAH